MLSPGGLLLARVNSFEDSNHGAGEGRQIEPGFYLNNGQYKRFFDDQMIQRFFSEWTIGSCSRYDIARFGSPKNLYEIAATPRSVAGEPADGQQTT